MANSLTRSINTRHQYLVVLAALLLLFCLRVLGQFLVAFLHVPFLPAMNQWSSGLIPYGPLFVCQVLIILAYGKVCIDLATGGYCSTPNEKFGRILLRSGAVYFVAMIIRYVMSMLLFPHERWLGGSIPIVFHLVLASFLITLGRYHKDEIKKLSGTESSPPCQENRKRMHEHSNY